MLENNKVLFYSYCKHRNERVHFLNSSSTLILEYLCSLFSNPMLKIVQEIPFSDCMMTSISYFLFARRAGPPSPTGENPDWQRPLPPLQLLSLAHHSGNHCVRVPPHATNTKPLCELPALRTT